MTIVPQAATLAVLAASVFAGIAILAIGATMADGWFDDESRHAATYVAAIAPVAGLVLAGIGGSWMGIGSAKPRHTID